ncbi:MAG: energy transducer TonB [Pseudomonadales bacterium]|nr:energy transducer TonB [Pseudomonadales bacterium]MDG1442513.1 energy transducer TonB [Pseudomonadales bacterium]
MATVSPAVTPSDRLGFTVFLALSVHAVIILGVTFTYLDRKPSTHTMEVTLAQHRSQNAPEKPDFLAQFNQVGSGTLKKKALTTSPNKADFHDTIIRETSPAERQAYAPKVVSKQKPVVSSAAKSDRKTSTENKVIDSVSSDIPVEGQKSLLQRSLEIASLEARLDRQRQIYAKRPRIKRLTSLSTASSTNAYYLNSWRRKIEKIGNLNYPAEARKNKLYGNLRVMVAILPDGSLKEVELLESSGEPVLDEAAIRIVRLAAPFAPFPDNLRQSTDVLEIIRTWQFRRNSSLRSY